jgi:hypothetical protein
MLFASGFHDRRAWTSEATSADRADLMCETQNVRERRPPGNDALRIRFDDLHRPWLLSPSPRHERAEAGGR